MTMFHWNLSWVNAFGFELNLRKTVQVNDIFQQCYIDQSWKYVCMEFSDKHRWENEFQPVESIHVPPLWLCTPGDLYQNQKQELESGCPSWSLFLSSTLTWHRRFPYRVASIIILLASCALSPWHCYSSKHFWAKLCFIQTLLNHTQNLKHWCTQGKLTAGTAGLVVYKFITAVHRASSFTNRGLSAFPFFTDESLEIAKSLLSSIL